MTLEFPFEWRSQVTSGNSNSKDKTQKVTFPTGPKIVENPSIKPNGKHKPKTKVQTGQTKLPW